MSLAEMKIEKFNICRHNPAAAEIEVRFFPKDTVYSPRVAIVFSCGKENRRLPMKTFMDGDSIVSIGTYDSNDIFLKKPDGEIKVSFVFSNGIDNGVRFDTDLTMPRHKRNPLKYYLSCTKREKEKIAVSVLFNIVSTPFRMLKIKKNRISFFTNRDDEPKGNLKAVYETVKCIEGADIHLVCRSGGAKGTLKVLPKFMWLYMTSRIVYVDDYYHLISYVKKKAGTTLIQLWHGCGAFKTAGYSRIHKTSRLEVNSRNHRQYDLAIVSSPDVTEIYAEVFGISDYKVLPLGSPRCDSLVDEEHLAKTREKIYEKYPDLKDKKVLLFAPTFRGKGNGNCYYPTEKFNVDKVLSILGDEWVIAIKLHPYLHEKFTCGDENAHRMIDCSSEDINDVLPVTSFLVTDYSSVIFEASILRIPMAFFVFDLEKFIKNRDFHHDFKAFIPGPMARTDEEIAKIVKEGKIDQSVIEEFRKKNFGDTLGHACENIKTLTKNLMNE